ncbi:2-keto-4-pentenoate hydratase [Agrobacterium rosae]|uniref:2-keto-4-pentenoate hydratase n=1 Tax=Agrobacterium rosae TaxID=1972867 RepID=A0AAW9FGU3_9HYPH|nr:2-keto-4-pentenoate hydratase [Agrobacterium rosae]MDX8302366.1 2-keto-4-pentenoate hydratase [Agrobacterium rosae]
MTTMTEANIRLGAILAEAENQQSSLGVAILESNGLVPETIEIGMAAQAIAAAAIGREVDGWKISFNSGRAIAAPLLDVYDTSIDVSFEVPKPGAVAVEIEICFVLANDIPPPATGAEYSREDVLSHIASAHLGAELVSYRLAEENKVPFPLFLADRLGNHSFVLGPELGSAVLERVANQDATLPALIIEGDDEVLFAAAAKHPQADPIAPLLAYANAPLDHLGGLKRGQVVTTGSLCGVIRLSGQTKIKASWDGIAEMTLVLPA